MLKAKAELVAEGPCCTGRRVGLSEVGCGCDGRSPVVPVNVVEIGCSRVMAVHHGATVAIGAGSTLMIGVMSSTIGPVCL